LQKAFDFSVFLLISISPSDVANAKLLQQTQLLEKLSSIMIDCPDREILVSVPLFFIFATSSFFADLFSFFPFPGALPGVDWATCGTFNIRRRGISHINLAAHHAPSHNCLGLATLSFCF
jgi:hypothetical protein